MTPTLPRYAVVAVGLSLCLTVASLTGCGSSSGAGTAQRQSPAPSPSPAGGGDLLGDFTGKRVDAGQKIVLDEFDYGLRHHGVILKLIKIHEQEYQEMGRKKVVTTTAEINARKGDEQKTLLIGEEEGKWAFGCKVNVSKARVDYVEKRQKWLPRATVVVNCK